MSVVEPFNSLVKLTARAFYDDITAKADHHQPKNPRSDNRGIAVIVLDALTRRHWVREEDLAKALQLQSKQLRRTLQILKDDKLVARDQRKETAKGAKGSGAAGATTSDGHRNFKENDAKMKTHTHTYWCLDYAQIHDVVRYRLHLMKKNLKNELDNSNTVQTYMCPNCGKRYSAFDALLLGSQNEDYFQCENCKGEVVPESDKLCGGGDGEDSSKRQRREKLKDMLGKMEEQLKPLTLQLARLKDIDAPEIGTLQAWEVRANAAAIANGDPSTNDLYRSNGTPMPFPGETKLEVAFPGVDAKEDETGTDSKTPALKVLPPWMIKQGMNLTKEQRGEVKLEDQSSVSHEDKKTNIVDDEKNIQAEYLKAYYAALAKRQEQQDEASKKMQQESERHEEPDDSEAPAERQVGMKSKRMESENDDVEWETASPTGDPGQESGAADLGAEANQSDNEDDIDWEEG